MNKLVLIVDDDESLRTLLMQVIEKKGFRVESAGDGRTALEKAKTDHPDLIVLDYMLPEMEGFEVIKRLQLSDTTRHIPVLLMTSRPVDPESVKMIHEESNVQGFLQKPIKIATFLNMLDQILTPGLKA